MRNNQKQQRPSGIDVSIEELIYLRQQAIYRCNPHRDQQLKLTGQRLTSIRGSGIEFDTVREYQMGDDIRNMAWRVIARSLKPQIKVYREERERSIWLAVDLSPSQYFGTRCMFKSVRSIKHATLLGWSYLLKHERIGAMIATEQKTQVFRPQFDEKHYLTILQALSHYSTRHPEFNETNYLKDLLLTLHSHVRSDHVIVIISDFYHFDQEIQKLIAQMAQVAQVELIFIYDPFEMQPPPPYEYVLTNGQQQIMFDMNNAKNRLYYQDQFTLKQKQLTDFSRKHSMGFHLQCTDQKE